MARSFTIPTIYTAVDRLSPALKRMEVHMGVFESRLNRTERTFRKLTPSIGNAAKQLLSYASAGAAIGAIAFSGKAVADFETEVANLSAITGVSGKALDTFKQKIFEVAYATKESSIEVAKAFTLVGNNTPSLLKDSAALSEVSKQSIILAQASRMELAPAAEYLTQVMNQFNKPASQAKQIIDLLSAGMVIGSQSIEGTADAITRFGGVASQGLGVKLEESVALIQLISDKMKDPEKIGTQFRNMFLDMANIKRQDPKAMKDLIATGVNMDIVSSKTASMKDRLFELRKLLNKPGALKNVFGRENIQSILPALVAAEKYQGLLDRITTSEEARDAASKMAAKTTNTFAYAVKQLANTWVNYITSSDKVNDGMEHLKDLTRFVTRNMDSIVKWTVRAVGAFLILKAVLFAVRAGWVIYNVALALNVILMGKSLFSLRKYATALSIVNTWTRVAAAAQWLWNAAVLASPYVLVAAGIAAIIALMVDWSFLIKKVTHEQQIHNNVVNRAMANTADQRVQMMLLFSALRMNEQGTAKYNTALSKLEEMQPGITAQYSLHLKYLGDMNRAEKDLADSIVKRGMVQAATELAGEKFREALQRKQEGATFMDYFKAVAFAKAGKGGPEAFVNSDVARLNKEGEMYANEAARADMPVQQHEFRFYNDTPNKLKQTSGGGGIDIKIKHTNYLDLYK